MALTIEQVKGFLKENADDILEKASAGDGTCMNIVSAVHFYNQAQNSYYEELVIKATEAYIKEGKDHGTN